MTKTFTAALAGLGEAAQTEKNKAAKANGSRSAAAEPAPAKRVKREEVFVRVVTGSDARGQLWQVKADNAQIVQLPKGPKPELTKAFAEELCKNYKAGWTKEDCVAHENKTVEKKGW